MALADLLELSNTLAWTLLHFLWQGVLVGVLYGLGKRLSASVAWHHALALSGLLAMLALPAATFWWLLQQPAALPAAGGLAAGAAALGGSMVGTEPVAAGYDSGPLWTFLLVAAWLSGALVISVRLFSDWRLIRTAIREGSQPSAALAELLAAQMQRIGVTRRVRLRLTARITTAGVYGLLRPVVLLPTALALSLPRDQLEALLVHELAHIRRADFLANMLALLARTLLYFHPVVHWLCRDLERTRETLCDDLVVGLQVDRLKYARALSTAEQFRQQVQVPVPLLTATGGELSARVHRILALAPDRRRDQDRAPLLLAVAAIVLSVLGLQGVSPEAPLAIARPEFRAAYQALFASPAPELARPGAVAGVRPSLILPTAAAVANEAPAAAAATGPAMASAIDTGPAMASIPLPEPLLAAANPAPLQPAVPEVAPRILATGAFGARDELAPTPPRVLRKVQPYYPRSARWQGLEGTVTLTYGVDGAGAPVAIEVVDAGPQGLFGPAALRAFQRWRFEPGTGSGARYSQTFDFHLGEDASRCTTRIGSRICRRPVPDAAISSSVADLENGARFIGEAEVQQGFTRQRMLPGID